MLFNSISRNKLLKESLYYNFVGEVEMQGKQVLFSVVLLLMLFSFIINACYSAKVVYLEFLYYEPCRLCPGQEEYYQVYLYNKEVVDKIEKDYGEKVIVERIRFDSTEGMEKVKEYNLSLGDWNTIVVNHELKFLGGDKRVNETYLRKIIDLHLRSVGIHSISVVDVTCLPNSVSIGEQIKINVTIKNDGNYTELFNVTIFIDFISIKSFFVTDLEPGKEISLSFSWNVTEMPEGTHILSAKVYLSQNSTEHSSNYAFLEVKNQSSSTFAGILIFAFSLGFFETFSPCLIIMLSFILGYTLSDSIRFKEGFFKVVIFGLGFVLASAILGLACGMIFFSMPNLQLSIMQIVCAFAIIFGLNLLGLLEIPIHTKPLLSKIAKKCSFRSFGIWLLGFVFYFLDPCTAPIFVSAVSVLCTDVFFYVLSIFCIGALVPFFGIGIFVGSISKLSRKAYKYRSVLRGLSGMILIGYALYLVLLILHGS